MKTKLQLKRTKDNTPKKVVAVETSSLAQSPPNVSSIAQEYELHPTHLTIYSSFQGDEFINNWLELNRQNDPNLFPIYSDAIALLNLKTAIAAQYISVSNEIALLNLKTAIAAQSHIPSPIKI